MATLISLILLIIIPQEETWLTNPGDTFGAVMFVFLLEAFIVSCDIAIYKFLIS